MGVKEQLEDGRSRRDVVPRASHGEWAPAPDRTDPVEVLLASNEGRVEELVPIRFGRMAVSPFTFLRGSAAVMAADLAAVPTTGLQVQACGDCHLLNFGLFATPERNVVFGLNDFDETMPGPWEWDVKRLVASFVVAGRDMRLKSEEPMAVAAAAVRAYRERMWQFAEMSPLEIWYDRIDLAKAIEDAPDKAARQRRQQLDQQARKRVAENLFPKLVTSRGRPSADRRSAAVDLPSARAHRRGGGRISRLLPHLDGRRSTGVVRPVSLRGCRHQSRRGGQCRHPLLRGVVHLRGWSSSAAASEGGQPVSAGGLPAGQPKKDPQRRTGGRRPAPHAAGQRHLPGLGKRTSRPGLLRRQLRDMKVSVAIPGRRHRRHPLRRVLWSGPGPLRQHRFCRRHRRVPRQQRQGRQGVRAVRGGLRRPDRARLPDPGRSDRQRPSPRHHGNHVGTAPPASAVPHLSVGTRQSRTILFPAPDEESPGQPNSFSSLTGGRSERGGDVSQGRWRST